MCLQRRTMRVQFSLKFCLATLRRSKGMLIFSLTKASWNCLRFRQDQYSFRGRATMRLSRMVLGTQWFIMWQQAYPSPSYSIALTSQQLSYLIQLRTVWRLGELDPFLKDDERERSWLWDQFIQSNIFKQEKQINEYQSLYLPLRYLSPQINPSYCVDMNLLSFMKRKEEKDKVEKNTHKIVRLDTETHPMVNKRPKTEKRGQPDMSKKKEKPQKDQRVQTNANQNVITACKSSKITLQIQQLLLTLCTLKNELEKQYDSLLTAKASPLIEKQTVELLATNYFRFRNATFLTALDQYSNILQALQLLISKLSNNDKITQKIMVRNEEDFVLFFKFFFSKPYTLMNLPSVRKVIKLLWDKFTFSSLTSQAMIDNLRLWIFGISAPLNPSMNKLHYICIEKSEQISRIVNHRSNEFVYIGVNESDALCLTPLMVATISRNTKGMQKLIKNGADPHICPLIINMKRVTSSIESNKSGQKIQIKKSFGVRMRMQPDVVQILRNDNRVEQIAQMLCWQSFYEMKKLRKDAQLSDLLSGFPDCSFQINWQEYRNMLCLKELPQDIVSVYKRKYSLRIDFHIADLQKWDKKKHSHYSLILKAEPTQEVKLYLIDHGQKKIRDLMEDRDMQNIKEKYTAVLKYGNIYHQQISEIKAIYFPKDNRLSLNLDTYHQNVNKFNTFKFRSQKQYFQDVMNSDLINYRELEKQEMQAILGQTVVAPQKVKSSTIESSCFAEVQWSAEALNLTHLTLLLRITVLAFPNSILLNKIQTITKVFEDPVMSNYQFPKKLPIRCKFSGEGDISIQSEIKNINYVLLQQSIFNLEVRAKEMAYEQIDEPVNLSHLQDTVYMDEMYSISASQFLGKSENLFELTERQANNKFQELLLQDRLWNQDDEQN